MLNNAMRKLCSFFYKRRAAFESTFAPATFEMYTMYALLHTLIVLPLLISCAGSKKPAAKRPKPIKQQQKVRRLFFFTLL